MRAMSDRSAAVSFFARLGPPVRPLAHLAALTRPLGTFLSSGDPSSFYYKLDGVAGGDGLQDLVLVGLATTSDQGDLRPMLAEAVPTAENGQWKVNSETIG